MRVPLFVCACIAVLGCDADPPVGRASSPAAVQSEAKVAPSAEGFRDEVPSKESRASSGTMEKEAARKVEARAIEALRESRIVLSELENDCAALAGGDPALTLGEAVRATEEDTDARETRCRELATGFRCETTLRNSGHEDVEFMVAIDYALDDELALVSNSLSCVLAG